MKDFWVNIIRYQRFFISSLLGLILIILAPIRNLFKSNKTRLILIFGFCLVIVLFFFIIIKMIALI